MSCEETYRAARICTACSSGKKCAVNVKRLWPALTRSARKPFAAKRSGSMPVSPFTGRDEAGLRHLGELSEKESTAVMKAFGELLARDL
jgi:hypothetical protein